MGSILCSLGYLLLELLTARYRADDADFFSCVSRLSRLHSRRGDTPGLRVGRFWPEIFESMYLGLPNQITAANAGERLGFAGKSRVGLGPRPAVAELGRSAELSA
jgi:hypothetical protein